MFIIFLKTLKDKFTIYRLASVAFISTLSWHLKVITFLIGKLPFINLVISTHWSSVYTFIAIGGVIGLAKTIREFYKACANDTIHFGPSPNYMSVPSRNIDF